MGDSSENKNHEETKKTKIFPRFVFFVSWFYFHRYRLSRLLRTVDHLAVSHVIVVAVGQDALPNPG
jgi:hypothetical protein